MKKCTLYNYRVEALNLSALEEKLESYKSRDLFQTELAHSGWGYVQGESRYISTEDIICLSFTTMQKILPASAVNSELKKHTDKFESENGRAPARHERAELKDTIINQLVANALTSTKSVRVLLLQSTNQVLVETTSKSQCDEIMVLLLKSLGMQLTMLELPLEPSVLMTRMVNEDSSLIGVDDFGVMDSGVLTNNKQKATFKGQVMQAENIQNMILDGYRVNQLAIGTETVTFTLVDDFTFKGIKYDVEFGDCVESDLLIIRDSIMEVIDGLLNALEGNK